MDSAKSFSRSLLFYPNYLNAFYGNNRQNKFSPFIDIKQRKEKNMRKNSRYKILGCAALLFGTYTILKTAAVIQNKYQDREYNNHPAKSNAAKTPYEKTGKKILDSFLSFGGLIILCPVLLALSVAVYIDDPGPVIFTQKRVGVGKTHFKLHKFRSMKMSTPHDTPTHLLENPDQYITRVGKFLRKYSLDELPQIWDIFAGRLSVVGPRPALWNQDDLITERDKYDANDVVPGLTGWAQINGRDELEIPIKAKLDGDYVKELRKDSKSGFLMDVKCFIGTLFSVAKAEGVVEGGTGEIHRAKNGETE